MDSAKKKGHQGRKQPANTMLEFWAKVDRSGDCWLYMGALDCKGYGLFNKDHKKVRAHRLSWEVHNGKITSKECVLHKCDIRNCVNLAHLFLGDNLINTADMVSKNRQAKGEQRPESKLTEKDILEIRQAYPFLDQAMLGAMYGVHPSNISRIVNGALWKHV